MTSWNVVEADFDGDETGNFGPRLESGSALYQVTTAAAISARERVTFNPYVSTTATEDTVCVSAGRHLSLFLESGRKHVGTLEFESDVECVTCTEDGVFAVVGEQRGVLHFISVVSAQILFSKTLAPPEEKTGSCTYIQISFTAMSDKGTCELLVVTGRSIVFWFRNICLSELREALEVKDIKKLTDIQGRMKTRFIDTSRTHTGGILCATSLTRHGISLLLTAGSGKSTISVWTPNNDTFVEEESVGSLLGKDCGIKKCEVSSDGQFLICLDQNGVMSLWSVHMLTVLKQWTEKFVVDFVVMELGNKKKNLNDLSVVLLTKPTEENCRLEICTLPNLDSTYTLQLTCHTKLATCPADQEAIFVVEGVNDNSTISPEDIITALRVRSLTEAQPETRFYRILHKRQFDEAEQFARMFNLDVELVYKVKASYLLDCLSPWNVDKLTEQEFQDHINQLKECIKVVEDDTDIVDCCVKAALPTYEATLDLLNCARSKLISKLKTKKENKDEDSNRILLTKIMETLHRLGTYQEAFGAEYFSGSHWDQFVGTNMHKEFYKWLSGGKLSIAFCIWKRHQIDFEVAVNNEMVEVILSLVPEQTLSEELAPWLTEDFIPFVIRFCPESLSTLAAWLEQRARNMEISEKHDWPLNSLHFCELLQNTCVSVSQSTSERGLATPQEFATQVCNLSVGYSQVVGMTCVDTPDALLRLHTLILQLRDLYSLHTKYNCKLSLAEYVQETTESLTYRMLDRVVALELIPSTIETIVRPYMIHHRLDENKMLYQYIGDLAARSGGVVSCLGDTPWEAKAIAVIGCIHDTEYKICAILDAMSRAYVPWSCDMTALVKEGLSLDHPRVAELKEQCALTELRTMLVAYDLRNYNVSEGSNSEILVYYILSQDRASSMEDALQVVKRYRNLLDTDAYSFRIRFLIQHNRLSECLELLRSLPEVKSHHCGQTFVTYTIQQLDCDILHDEDSKTNCLLFTKAACEILKFLLNLSVIERTQRDDLEHLMNDFRNILALQVEFSQFISYSDYQKETVRKLLMKKYLQLYFSSKAKPGSIVPDVNTHPDPDKKRSKNKTWSYTKIYRMAEILKFSRDVLRGQLAVTAAKTGDVQRALKLSNDLFEYLPNETTADVLYQVVHCACQLRAQEEFYTSDAKVITATLYDLASKALTVCRPELRVDCLQLCKICSMALDVSRQCESGAYGESVDNVMEDENQSSIKDPYKEWLFDHFFKEDGLVIDSETIMPLVYRYSLACLPVAEIPKYPYHQCSFQGTSIKETVKAGSGFMSSALPNLGRTGSEVIQCLVDNSQIELALRYSLDLLAVTEVHINSQRKADDITETNKRELLSNAIAHFKQIEKPLLFKIPNYKLTMISKILSQGRLDHNLSVGYLSSLPKQVAFDHVKKIIRNTGHEYRKIMALTQVGINFAVLCKEPKVELMFRSIETNALWGHRLGKLKISFDRAFNMSMKEHRDLIPAIVQNDGADINLIQDYCSSFQLDPVEALSLYLKHLLFTPAPPGDGTCRKSIATTQVVKADAVIQGFKNIDSLLPQLRSLRNQIDSYNYEMLGFVLKKVHEISPSQATEKNRDVVINGIKEDNLTFCSFPRFDVLQDLEVLNYLISYKRIAPPSQFELSLNSATEEEQLMYGSRPLSPLSAERLPFHPVVKGETWKIISPELTPERLNVWLPMAALLELMPDQIYLTTIRNMVNKHVKAKGGSCARNSAAIVDKSKCNWNKKEGHDNKLFETIRSLLLKVSNCEMAVMCVSWVVSELPMGAEKVLALQASVMLTQKWIGVCQENTQEMKKAQDAFSKFSEIYRRLSTEQALYQCGLGQAEYLNLCNTPAKLIFTLYQHDSILQRLAGGSIVEALPDIHALTEKIATINKVNVSRICLTLVEKWLPSSSQSRQDEADTTLNFSTFNPTMQVDESSYEDEINLKRVVYILQKGPLDKNAFFLLNFAFKILHTVFKSKSTKITSMCRVRALRCLFSLTDKQTIERIADKPTSQIREFMQMSLYQVELDRLHVAQSIEFLQQGTIEAFVRGIWRNHSHEPRAVRLVADTCLDYDVIDADLWNSILMQLMAFQMMAYLRHVLVSLAGVPCLWSLDCLQRLWRTVILSPLSQVSFRIERDGSLREESVDTDNVVFYLVLQFIMCQDLLTISPLSQAQMEECLRSYSLLHRCPLALDMDLQTLAKQFQRVELSSCAIGCLILLPRTPSRNTGITKILQSTTALHVLDQLTKFLTEKRIIPLAERIQKTVYNFVNKQQLFSELVTSRYLEDFVGYLIAENDVTDLILHALQQNKLANVVHLLGTYRKAHPGSEFVKLCEEKQASDLDIIKVFLELHGLQDKIAEYLPEDEPQTPSELSCDLMEESNLTTSLNNS